MIDGKCGKSITEHNSGMYSKSYKHPKSNWNGIEINYVRCGMKL